MGNNEDCKLQRLGENEHAIKIVNTHLSVRLYEYILLKGNIYVYSSGPKNYIKPQPQQTATAHIYNLEEREREGGGGKKLLIARSNNNAPVIPNREKQLDGKGKRTNPKQESWQGKTKFYKTI